ncbi:hypothetical protein TWF679_004047 [Orbilia oligospora]|uniref:Uncharacterized protein n=1 Tax=Orbilia oligospora TaxID=2813651 RepID=A0A8H8UQH9_ORBOL|nr:hypothetical protein TWF679_004047 [Orbilia oligospora]
MGMSTKFSDHDFQATGSLVDVEDQFIGSPAFDAALSKSQTSQPHFEPILSLNVLIGANRKNRIDYSLTEGQTGEQGDKGTVEHDPGAALTGVPALNYVEGLIPGLGWCSLFGLCLLLICLDTS